MEITKLFVKCSVLLFENTDTGQYLVDTRSTTSASVRGFDIVLVFDNPMTNKIKKFLYILQHLIPDGHDEIPTLPYIIPC